MLFGCQSVSIQNMVTERHNIASRLIITTLSKGDFGGNIISQILEAKHRWLHKVWSCRHMWPTGLHPSGVYHWQTFQQTNFDPALDQMQFAYCQLERKMAIKETCWLYTLRAGQLPWDVHLIEVKYCDNTRPEQQLARATGQHIELKHALAQQCHKVHTILIGVMGNIYKCHTELSLSKHGLDRCRVRKLTFDLHAHSIQ